ncbi:MAG: Nif3-like dinuclear metal center hexameric protein [Syntrophomonadaceae bacterium]|nr:Nif3-like dinuclear metal center hexameric protein [Syntrophomonadaceae bacterium]
MPVTVKAIADILEEHFPPHLAAEWDNPGLQVGSRHHLVENILLVLDIDDEVVDFACRYRCGLIITHHPFFFAPVKSINYDQSQGRLLKKIIEAGITVYSAHTNLDAGARGLNQVLAERLGLVDIRHLDRWHCEKLFKLVVYVPSSHEEEVRAAILGAGAGHTGRYQDCSFMSKGIGSFRPLPGSQPFIGQQGRLEEVEEFRLESIVPQSRLEQVIERMGGVHPYEEIAYDLYPLELDGPIYSMGRVGRLATPCRLEEYCRQVKQVLKLDHLRVAGNMDQMIKRVAVVSGAGADYASLALLKGCDVLVTGDVKYHQAKDARDAGLAMIDAGHEGTERIMADLIKPLLVKEMKNRGLDAQIFGMESQEVLKTC